VVFPAVRSVRKQALIRAVDEPQLGPHRRATAASVAPADGAERVPLVGNVRRAVLIALCLMAYVWLSETLQLVVRNKHFLLDLGGSLAAVLAVYIAFAIAIGVAVGVLVRKSRWQCLAIAAVFYAALSLKMFWLDAPLLMVPSVAIMFCIATVLGAAMIVIASRRFALPSTTPILVVAAYFHVCQAIAANWAMLGGNLVAFLVARDTLVSVGTGAAGLAAAVLVLRWLEQHWPARARWAHPALLLVLAIVIVSKSARHVDSAGSAATASSESPDIYVLSFDALRRDTFDQYVAAHPGSAFAELVANGTQFKNIVTEGASTYSILSNNTYAGSSRQGCADSIPGRLDRVGYATAMLLGRYAKRIQGSHCYDYYYSGKGESLVGRYSLPALGAAFLKADAHASERAAFMSSRDMVTELERVVAATPNVPIFGYLHFLALHAPYVANDPGHADQYGADIKRFMRECYLVACDATDPDKARLIAIARAAYEKKLAEQDAVVRRIMDMARARGRSFVIVITADHGELFGEHGGFAHSGGFVRELLNVPFVVYDSRVSQRSDRCELMRASEALLVTTAVSVYDRSAVYPDHESLEIDAPPLGTAVLERATQTIRYEIAAQNEQHAGTWRNIHRSLTGTVPYPVDTCRQ
jgi:hypothetical protein